MQDFLRSLRRPKIWASLIFLLLCAMAGAVLGIKWAYRQQVTQGFWERLKQRPQDLMLLPADLRGDEGFLAFHEQVEAARRHLERQGAANNFFLLKDGGWQPEGEHWRRSLPCYLAKQRMEGCGIEARYGANGQSLERQQWRPGWEKEGAGIEQEALRRADETPPLLSVLASLMEQRKAPVGMQWVATRIDPEGWRWVQAEMSSQPRLVYRFQIQLLAMDERLSAYMHSQGYLQVDASGKAWESYQESRSEQGFETADTRKLRDFLSQSGALRIAGLSIRARVERAIASEKSPQIPRK